jgi:hypothetical protein
MELCGSPAGDLIVKRWEKFTGQNAVLSRSGKLVEGGYAKIAESLKG